MLPGAAGCDDRIIDFGDGSILILRETASNFQIPGQSYYQPPTSFGNQFSLTLTDQVDGSLSTGIFSGASGTLSGEVKVAGGMAIVALSGLITLR